MLEPLLPVPCRCGGRALAVARDHERDFLRAACSCPCGRCPPTCRLRAAYRCSRAARRARGGVELRPGRATASVGRGAARARVMDSQSVRTTEAAARAATRGKRCGGASATPSPTPAARPGAARPSGLRAGPHAVPLLRRAPPLPAPSSAPSPTPPTMPARRRGDPDRRRDRAQEGGPNRLRRAATRWVIERTFAWLGRNRRLARYFEATIASAPPSSTPRPSCCSPAGSAVAHVTYLFACAS